MVGVAIVGAGTMGKLHASLLSKDERVSIRGFADVMRDRARTAVRTYGGEPFTDYQELIDRRDVDAVFVTVPNALHAEPVLYAIATGKHVFSEKPMATTVDEATRIKRAMEKEGLVYQVGFNKRFAPAYQRLKRAVSEHEAPTMVLAKMNRGELQNPEWVGDPRLTGGYLYETPIHAIDICRYVLDDEVTEVRCKGTASVYRDEQLDNVTAQLTFARGTMVTLFSCAHATWAFPWERLEFFGEHWMAETEEFDRFRYSASLHDAPATWDFSLLPREERWGYAAQDKAFIDAIVDGKPPEVSAEDGLQAVRVVAACYESASTGSTVVLDES